MSAYAALNGTPVTRARIVLPLTGIWHADVWLDRVVDVSGSQTLAVGPWSGTCSVLRAIDFAGQRMLRLVGGAGKWPSIPTTPLFWAGAQLSTILGDVASAVGEQVNVVSDRTVSPFYVMDGATPASTVLQDLAGDGWWMDLAGVTQIGTRPTPTIASPFTLRDVENRNSGQLPFRLSENAGGLPGRVVVPENLRAQPHAESMRSAPVVAGREPDPSARGAPSGRRSDPTQAVVDLGARISAKSADSDFLLQTPFNQPSIPIFTKRSNAASEAGFSFDPSGQLPSWINI